MCIRDRAEERKRLNAAFSHDLRNPITVLKGSVKLLRQGIQDEQTIDPVSYTHLDVYKRQVLGLIKRTSAEFRQTVVMITHNNDIARLADRIVRIEDGKIVE